MSNEDKCFLFHFKPIFVLENSTFSNFMITLNAYAKNKKYISVNNLGSKHSLLVKFGQFMSYHKSKNFIKIFCKNCGLKISSRPLCLHRIAHSFYWKTKFLKQATYIRYVIAKLLKFVQITMLTSLDSFLQRILWKLKKAWNKFPGHIFYRIFW